MKKGLKKLTACLLILMLMCADLCVAAEAVMTLDLPDKLVSIGEEAFSGTASVQKVVVPEGTKRIESRAFADSSAKEIHLPLTVEFIADDAFEGSDHLALYVLKESYAHKWAAFRGMDFVVVDADPAPERKYALSGLKIIDTDEGACLSADVTTDEACRIIFQILDEANEKWIASYVSEVKEQLRGETVTLSTFGDLPEYFILEAVLEDDAGNALCDPLRVIRYTQAYINAQNADAGDYPADRVIEFGDAGFMVLAEGVVNIEEEATVIDGSYSIPESAFGGRLPSKGDVLMLNVNGVLTPVKVGSIAAGKGSSVRIEADKDIYLCDAMDKMNINGYVEAGEDGAGGGLGAKIPLNEKYTSKDGMLTVTATGGVSVYVNAQYDKNVLGRDYFEFEAEANVLVDVTGTVTGKCATETDEIKLDLYRGKVIIPGINLPADMEIILPFNCSVEGAGTLNVHYEKMAGFTWDSRNGFVEKEDPDKNSADADMRVKFHADAGPKVILGLKLWEFFGATVDAQVGAKMDGELFSKLHAGYEEPVEDDVIHACDSCMSIDVDLFAKANANIYYKITEEISDDLLEETIFDIDLYDLLDLYASLINEKESIFGGQYAEGIGICPNNKYRVGFSTQDMYGKAVKGIMVDITGTNGFSGSVVTPAKLHLYDASYQAKATFPSGTSAAAFLIDGAPQNVVVKEKEMTIEGVITDSKTGNALPGATVKLTLPDGSTKTAVTGDDGRYYFDKLAGGTYSFLFSKEGYETKPANNLTYTSGGRVQFNVALEPAACPMLSAMTSQTTWVQAVTADGTCPSYLPQVWLETNIPSDRYGVTVKVHHSACEEPLEITYEQSVYSIRIKAADMGEGEYIYLLSASSAGRMGGWDHTIFRVRNGEFIILGEFDLDSHSMDIPIYLDAEFTSANQLTGTIEPMGIGFVATFDKSDSGRIGRTTTRRRLGYMDFVLNKDGYYDLEFTTDEYYEYIMMEFFGTTYNLFAMKNGKLELQSQDLEISVGSVSFT